MAGEQRNKRKVTRGYKQRKGPSGGEGGRGDNVLKRDGVQIIKERKDSLLDFKQRLTQHKTNQMS